MTEILFPVFPELEIVSSRVFSFPQAQVYEAWSNPGYLKIWWGPNGFTNTFHEFDFRVGGRWKFTMHGPDKGNYENEVEFVKMDPPRLVAWKRHSKPLFKVVAAFTPVSETETELVFRMVFDSKEECDKIRRFAVDKNEENFDRLEEVLRSMKS